MPLCRAHVAPKSTRLAAHHRSRTLNASLPALVCQSQISVLQVTLSALLAARDTPHSLLRAAGADDAESRAAMICLAARSPVCMAPCTVRIVAVVKRSSRAKTNSIEHGTQAHARYAKRYHMCAYQFRGAVVAT